MRADEACRRSVKPRLEESEGCGGKTGKTEMRHKNLLKPRASYDSAIQRKTRGSSMRSRAFWWMTNVSRIYSPPVTVELGSHARREAKNSRSSATGTRVCSIVSRERTVTVSSSSESKSTVTQKGVPISSWRR